MLELFREAGWVAYPLGLMSVLALGVVLERLYTLARLKRVEERAFMVLQMSMDKPDEAALRDPEIASAPVTQVMTQISRLRGASEEMINQAAEIALQVQRLRLRRYLSALASIGSTAPFVGLFGTVLGVMRAFQGMAGSGLSGEQMALGISEALAATAVGLLVAIPAVLFYNFLTGRVAHQFMQIHGHVARLTPYLAGHRAAAPAREKVEA
jgi:biopolymer transport protein ExbB